MAPGEKNHNMYMLLELFLFILELTTKELNQLSTITAEYIFLKNLIFLLGICTGSGFHTLLNLSAVLLTLSES